MLNALTVDVEEYFQVHAFEEVVGRENWENYESRVEASTSRILDILAETGTRASFFILGWIAERHPILVRRIRDAGHEVATHGYGHWLVYRQTPDQFRSDLQRSLDIIQDITGEKVLGFRAPSFSITKHSLWAVDVVQECGLRYDSSIYPARPLVHNRYGFPGAPCAPYLIRPGLWEFPMTIVHWLGRDFPIGGGGWLRHYPYALTRWGLRKVNAEGRPAIVYLHPWEVDPEQPRINGSLWRQFLHYHNLDKTGERIRTLCREFYFAPVREVLGL
jgi:polysaccharide deacetylase family protein (PEP-CTERM system associated)